ncbi:PH domain-containing protein [Virgibacillus kimchii]
MKFHSNKDLTYGILIWASALLFIGLSLGLFFPIYNEAGLVASLIFSLLFGISGFFILWFWFRTFYIVTDHTLIIYLGPFKRKIKLNSIKKIEKTYAQVASIALSKERYFLYYNANDYTIIAPANIEKFIEVINKKRSHPVEFLK